MTTETPSNSPASIDDLVKFIAQSVSDLYVKNGQRMDGSLLAYTIRSQFPEMDYTQLGLTRLGDAVRIAENLKLVVRNRDVKHLELSPPDAVTKTESNAESSDERRYVRNDIWRAFVFRSRLTPFLDRESLRLTDVSGEDSKTISTFQRDKKYIEITRISDDEQISWAKLFGSSSSDSGEFSEDEAKELIFAKSNKYGTSFIRSWKTFLTSKVTDHIQTWAAKNDVATDEILVPTKSRSELDRLGAPPSDDAAIRQAIISAIKEMPLSDLDDIPIPIKYIRRHFTAK